MNGFIVILYLCNVEIKNFLRENADIFIFGLVYVSVQ